jgi:hypothetical protein
MYICSGSFAYNGKDSDNEVLERLSIFTELTTKVGQNFHEDNSFFANYTELNETILFSDKTTFSDLLYGNTPNKSFELQQTFYLILTQGYFESTDRKSAEIDKLISQNNEDNCNAKVVLSKENEYKKGHCIVATYNDWLLFRSYLLGLYPGKHTDFFRECQRYFENLVISADYQIDSQQVLTTHSTQICHILYCMNIYMLSEIKDYKGSRIDFPKNFASNHEIEDGSFEGNGKTKQKYLTMNFHDGKRVCEAHFKYNSINGKRVFNDVRDYCRVYFAVPNKGDNKIYVGAILNHTKQCN